MTGTSHGSQTTCTCSTPPPPQITNASANKRLPLHATPLILVTDVSLSLGVQPKCATHATAAYRSLATDKHLAIPHIMLIHTGARCQHTTLLQCEAAPSQHSVCVPAAERKKLPPLLPPAPKQRQCEKAQPATPEPPPPRNPAPDAKGPLRRAAVPPTPCNACPAATTAALAFARTTVQHVTARPQLRS